jgi:hypothetical protein
MSTGIKHLINCRCILQQFKKLDNPPSHKFLVFSSIDDDDNVKTKYAKCNNCGIIHKVIEIGKSEILKKDEMASILSVDDIKASLPEHLSFILEKNSADLPSWESAKFIFENKKWGDFVVITTEDDGDTLHGKYVTILSENTFRVESFERQEILK